MKTFKNIQKHSKTFLTLFFSIILFNSCQKNDPVIIPQTKLEKISEKNQIFFDQLIELKTVSNEDDFNLKAKNIIKEYKKAQPLSLNKERQEKKLSEKQHEILNKYFENLSKQENKIDYANSYLLEILNQQLEEDDEYFCLNVIDLHKKIMIYVNIDSYQKEDAAEKINWRRCRFRDCIDCCMYRKALAFERSNWIEKAQFLLTAGESTLVWVTSCAWDCNF